MLIDHSYLAQCHQIKVHTTLLKSQYLYQVLIDYQTQYEDIEALFHFYNIELPERIQKARLKRKVEFFIGRLALQYALNQQGVDYFQLSNGKYGEPLWPKPFLGSISHSMENHHKGMAIVAIQKTHHVGVDIELKKNILFFNEQPNMLNQFLNKQEINYITLINPIPVLYYLIIFSAKESIIKVLCSKYNEMIYFNHIDYLKCDNQNNRILS